MTELASPPPSLEPLERRETRLAVQAGADKQPTHIWIIDVATGAG